jgi:hypothetical protein
MSREDWLDGCAVTTRTFHKTQALASTSISRLSTGGKFWLTPNSFAMLQRLVDRRFSDLGEILSMSDNASPGGLWSMAVGDDEGRPVLFRVRTEMPAELVRAGLPHLIAMLWPYQPDNDAGLPSSADAEQMSAFEDCLTNALQATDQAIMTAVVTGTGLREWQWYVRDPEETMRRVQEAISAAGLSVPVEFAGDPDPQWEGYQRALAILNSLASDGAFTG